MFGTIENAGKRLHEGIAYRGFKESLGTCSVGDRPDSPCLLEALRDGDIFAEGSSGDEALFLA